MDIVTLSMAKAYSDSKGGYTKPGKILVEVPLENGSANTENIVGLVEGQEYIAYATDRGVTENLGTFVAKKGDLYGIPVIYIGELIDGTQFAACDVLEENDTLQGFFVGTKYNSPTTIFHLEQPETIVPIDPKFLPGVCLPVVELTTVIPADGTQTVLSEQETASVLSAAENKQPIIIGCNVDNGDGIGIVYVRTVAGYNNMVDQGGVSVYSGTYTLGEIRKLLVYAMPDGASAMII